MECAVACREHAGSGIVTKYLVAYARIQSDKDSEITLQGVYFGGMGDTPEEAEKIARECVNTIKGGTILPKVLLVDTGQVIDAMLNVTDTFEKVTSYMVDADNTIRRSSKR